MVKDSMEEKKKRIELLDALRGFAVVLMVIHHAFYSGAMFLGTPWWLYKNPVFSVLQLIFIGLFVLISGISSRFSKGNIERGSIVIVIAVIITYVTVRMDMPIYFGILHLLGLFMIFYGLTRKLWDKIPRKAAPFIYIALFIAAVLAKKYLSPVSENLVLRDLLSVLGWPQKGFINYDMQTILPCIFTFLFGTWLGEYIREGKFPRWFYDVKVPFFPLVGRNALVIYVVHQPVLFAIAMGINYFLL